MGYLKLNEMLEKRIEIHLSFQNLTSLTAPINEIKLINLSDKGCSLALSNKCCALSHQVLVRFVVKDLLAHKNSHPKEIEVTGKVSEKNPIDEQNAEISIVFQQYVKEEWKLILDIFEQKQNFINDVLTKLKQNSNE